MIINRIMRKVVLFIMAILVKNKSYSALSTFLALVIIIKTFLWRLANLSVTSNKKKTLNTLCFDRSVFNKDLIEIQNRTGLNVFLFPIEIYTGIADLILPEKMRHQICYHISEGLSVKGNSIERYCSGFDFNMDRENASRLELRDLVNGIFLKIVKLLNIDFMMTANVQYYQDHEWINVAKHLNFPFISLVKEGIGTVESINDQIAIFKDLNYKYKGLLVIVYSDAVKALLVDSGVVDSKDAVVAGSPRTDLVYDCFYKKRNNENYIYNSKIKQLVVFFDYFEYADLNNCTNLNATSIYKLWRESIVSFVESARHCQNDNIKFVIKTKNSLYAQEINKEFGINFFKIKNLVIDSDIKFSDIAKYSICILGYRSTALIKFMATSIPIIIFSCKDVKDNQTMYDYSVYKNAAIVLNNIGNLGDYLLDICNYCYKPTDDQISIIMKERTSIIKDHLHRIDGNRSLEVERIINSTISV